ncbi:MAG: hypothetical protein Q7T04_03440 [Dehalococcoidia bacterium]|nr:hypothetical protein [Dehalococcoidia bacterium]
MNTLIDFVRYTKGWEYVIAISAFFSFAVLWMLVTRGRSGKGGQDVAARVGARAAPDGSSRRGAAQGKAGDEVNARRPAA